MYEILLVDALESFHDLYNDFQGLFHGEHLPGQFGLVIEQVTLFTVLHDYHDEITG